ncbi:calpain-5-like [Lampetra planeri]
MHSVDVETASCGDGALRKYRSCSSSGTSRAKSEARPLLPLLLLREPCRVFCRRRWRRRELTKDSPLESCWVVFHRPPVRVVTVHLRAAKVPGKTGISPYGVIICEDVRVKSDVFKGTQEAAFNTRAIFYQRRPDKPIVIQVWSSHWLKDELLGEVGLPELNQAEDEHTLQLETREGGGGGGGSGGGTVMVHVRCSDDITAL